MEKINGKDVKNDNTYNFLKKNIFIIKLIL